MTRTRTKLNRQRHTIIIMLEESRTAIDRIIARTRSQKIIFSSRGVFLDSVDRIREKGFDVQYIPLDLDEVFQRAKDRHLEAMTSFRRWFFSSPGKEMRSLWWLTRPSFRQSVSDWTVDLFLCFEFLHMLRSKYTDVDMSCYLISNTPVNRHFFTDWPIKTKAVTTLPCVGTLWVWVLRDLFSIALRLFRNIVKKNDPNKKNIPQASADVVFVSQNLASCFENSHYSKRDLYYADLPQCLIRKGFKVIRMIGPKSKPFPFTGQVDIEYFCQWHIADLLHATLTTAKLAWFSWAAMQGHWRKIKKSWDFSLFAYSLLTGFSLFQRNVTVSKTFNRLFRQINAKAVVFYDEVYFFGRALILAVQKLPADQRPITIGLQHGVVSVDQLTYVTDVGDPLASFPSCDYYFVFNEMASECYQRFLYDNDASRLKVTGINRIVHRDSHTLTRAISRLTGLDPSKPIFLLIGTELNRQRVLWETLLEILKRQPVQLIIKPHQAFPFPQKWLDAVPSSARHQVIYITDLLLDDLLSQSDYVISNISTGLYNVVVQHKHAIIFNYSDRWDVSQLFKWFANQKDAAAVSTKEDLQRTVMELARNKPQAKAQYSNPKWPLPQYFGQESLDLMVKNIDSIISS